MCSSTSETITRSKLFVGERQVERVAVDDAGPLVELRLAGFDHRARDRGDVLEVGGGVVERGDARAAAHRLERVAAAARPEVEQALAGREPEPVEVNRQHQATPESKRRRACASSSR